MKNLVRIIRLILLRGRQSIIYDLQYRTSYIINLFASTAFILLSFLTINTIGSNAPIIADNWTKQEYNLVWSIFMASALLVNILFKRSIEKIPGMIIRGELDFAITKPFDSKIFSSLNYIRTGAIPVFIFTFYISYNSFSQIHLDLNPLQITTMLLILMLFTSIIEYSLYISFISLSFWLLGASNLVFLYTRIHTIANYPIKAFGKGFNFFFTFIFPLAFVASIPSEAIINRSFSTGFIVIIVAFITNKVSSFIWELGLKSYSSASS